MDSACSALHSFGRKRWRSVLGLRDLPFSGLGVLFRVSQSIVW